LIDNHASSNWTSEHWQEAQMLIHTLKGGASLFSLSDFEHFCHEMEDAITSWREENPVIEKKSSIEHNEKRVQFLQMLQEKFNKFWPLTWKNLADLLQKEKFPTEKEIFDFEKQDLKKFLTSIKNQFPQLSRQFEGQFLMTSLNKIIFSYNDLLLDLAQKSNRSLYPLRVSGRNIRLHKERFQELISNLSHLFKNSLAHGIQSPEERLSAGKDPSGLLSFEISYYHIKSQDYLFLEFEDDGVGVNLQKVIDKALAIDLITQEESRGMNKRQILQLLADPRFSIQGEINTLSGRGVGLSSVSSCVSKLNGQMIIDSELSKGFKALIVIPLSEKEFYIEHQSDNHNVIELNSNFHSQIKAKVS